MASPVNPATYSKTSAKPTPPGRPKTRSTPPAILILGEVGSGKTDTLLSCINAGKELFVVVTEPKGRDTLFDSLRRRKLPIEKLHYHLIEPPVSSLANLAEQARLTNTRGIDELQKLDSQLDRKSFTQFRDLIACLMDFTCDRTGESFGDVTTWDDSRVLVIDSLSGLNHMVVKSISGLRTSMTLPEFGIAQTLISDFVLAMTGLNCYFIMTAHLELEPDALTGRIIKTVSTVGKKLSAKLPVHFSEIVLQRCDGKGQYTWSTMEASTALKHRALAHAAGLPADLAPLIRAYDRRKALLEQEELSPTKTTL